MKMPKMKKKLDPKIFEQLIPLTLLALVIGVGGVWVIRNYITTNGFVIMGYIIVFWLIFQSKFVEVVRGPEYFKKKSTTTQKKAKETRKKYGGSPKNKKF